MILLTDHEEVANWARLEALAGEVSLVEPETEPRTGDLARRAGHLTA